MHANSLQVTSAVLTRRNSLALANTFDYGKLLDVGVSCMINIILHVIEAEGALEMEVEDSARRILVVKSRDNEERCDSLCILVN